MAAVVAHAFVLVSEYVPGAKQAGNAVGKLDFAADAYSGLAQMLEYFGLQHITPHNGECRGGGFRRGFFHNAIQPGGRSEEHTSALQSLMRISYAVFCLKKKMNTQANTKQNEEE